MWLWLPQMGVLKWAQSSDRPFSVQVNKYSKGEAVGQVKRALSHEAEDTGSSPGPGSLGHRELGLSFLTSNRKMDTWQSLSATQ